MPRKVGLGISITADNSEEARALRKSQAEWRRHSRAVGRDIADLGNAVKVAAAAIGASLGAVSVAAINLGRETSRMAKNAGVSATAFQELEFAFRTIGVESDDLTSVLQNTAEKMFELANGEKAIVESFDAIGLSAKDFENLELDKQFELIVEALSRTDDVSRRTAVAMQLFGEEGVRIGGFMEEGADGVIALRKEAQQLGVVLSEDALDAADRLHRGFTTLTTVISKNFAQGLLGAIEGLGEFGDITRLVGAAARKMGEIVAALGQDLYNHRGIIIAVGAAWAGWRAILVGAALLGGLKNIVAALGALRKVIAGGAVATALAGITTALTAISAPALAVAAGVIAVTAGLVALYAKIKGEDAFDILQETWDGLKETLGGLLGSLNDAEDEMLDFEGATDNLTGSTNDAAKAATDYIKNIEGLSDVTVDLTSATAGVAKELDDIPGKARSSSRAFRNLESEIKRVTVEADKFTTVFAGPGRLTTSGIAQLYQGFAGPAGGRAAAPNTRLRERIIELIKEEQSELMKLVDLENDLAKAAAAGIGPRDKVLEILEETRIKIIEINKSPFIKDLEAAITNFGDSAAAALSGAIVHGENFGDALENIAKNSLDDVLTGSFERLFKRATDGLINLISGSNGFTNFFSNIGSGFTNFFSKAGSGFTNFVSNIFGSGGGGGAIGGSGLSGMLSSFGGFTSGAGAGFSSMLTGMTGGWGLAAAGIVAGLKALGFDFGEFFDFVNKNFEIVAGAIVDVTTAAFDTVGDIAETVGDTIVGTFRTVGDTISSVAGRIIDLQGRLLDLIGSVTSTVGRVASNVVKETGSVIRTGIETVGNVVTGVVDSIASIFGGGRSRGGSGVVVQNSKAIGEWVAFQMYTYTAGAYLPVSLVDIGSATLGLLAAVLGPRGSFQEGGIVPGPIGQPRRIIAHGGEAVFNQDQLAVLRGSLARASRGRDTEAAVESTQVIFQAYGDLTSEMRRAMRVLAPELADTITRRMRDTGVLAT